MTSFLKQLQLDEVLSVRDGANPHARILLMKRAAAVTPEDALRESVRSAFDDDDLVDKAGWIEDQLKEFRAHVAKGVVAFKKGESEMSTDEILVKVAKVAKDIVDGGAPTEFPKSALYSALKKGALETCRPGRSEHQAVSDYIVNNPTGNLIFSAMRFAKGPEIEPAASPWPALRIPGWSDTGNTDDFGPANKEMNVRASDHAKANPRKSPQSAYAYTYTHPDNIALREACKEEERKFKMGKVA
jgi:hypothetical protein